MSVGTLADPFIKKQITETIEYYFPGQVVIKLKGSEENWNCLFDASGLCGTSSTQVELYYQNTGSSAYAANVCDTASVAPVGRNIPTTITPIADTIELLLQGDLTTAEKSAGFTTEFPGSQFTLTSAVYTLQTYRTPCMIKVLSINHKHDVPSTIIQN